MDEQVTPRQHGNHSKLVVKRSHSYYGQVSVRSSNDQEKANSRLSYRSSQTSYSSRQSSGNTSSTHQERKHSLPKEVKEEYSSELINLRYSRHDESRRSSASSNVRRVSRSMTSNVPGGDLVRKQGTYSKPIIENHISDPSKYDYLSYKSSKDGMSGDADVRNAPNVPQFNSDSFQEITFLNGGRSKSRGKLHRSQSTDLAMLNRKKRNRQVQRQSYVPLCRDDSSDLTLTDLSDHSSRSLKYRRSSHSDLHSLKKLSKHQKYFYTDDSEFETSSPLHTSSDDHTRHDHNFHSIRDSHEVRVDIDFKENDAHPVLADDDYSFPALGGYMRHGIKHSFPSAPFKRLKYYRGNICLVAITTILTVLGALFVFCPLIVMFSVCLPLCYCLKKCFSCCCCYDNCSFGHLLSRYERGLLDNNEGTSIYHALIFVEYGLDIHRIRDLIHARIICAEDKSTIKLYPNFTKKIAQTCSGPAWVPDHSFFINNHVYSMPRSVENIEDLQEYVSEISSKALSFQSPLWEIQVLKNFGDQRETVLLVRVHPVVADGMTLAQSIYASLTDMDSIACSVPKFSHQGLFLNHLKAILLGPLIYFHRYLCSGRDFNMLHGKHVHRSGHHVVSWSEPYSLEKATRIRQVTRSTMNDVFLSVAAGVLRTYLRINGIDNPYDMQALVPVHYMDGWQENISERNRYLLMSVPIPTNTEGAIPRLWGVKGIMDNISSMALFSVTQASIWLTSVLLPSRLFSCLWRRTYEKCTCIISNVPGPETTLRFGSREVNAMMCWMPPQKNVSISITFVTYGEQVRMSVVTDRSVLPNPEMLTREFTYQVYNVLVYAITRLHRRFLLMYTIVSILFIETNVMFGD